MTTAIKTSALTKRYKNRVAVDALDIEVKQGEFFALLGENGAGKTTTIKMLCALTAPTDGDATVEGESVSRNPEAVKKRINVSPQETAVASKLTARENLEMIAGIYGARRAEARSKAEEMLARFGLTERADDRASRLSGGMQRRLSIAMALISEPSVLFLDEPTLGLDVRARRELWKQIEQLKGKITVILTTHYLEEAQALADRICIMQQGRVRALGTLSEILSNTGAATLEDAFLGLCEGGTAE